MVPDGEGRVCRKLRVLVCQFKHVERQRGFLMGFVEGGNQLFEVKFVKK